MLYADRCSAAATHLPVSMAVMWVGNSRYRPELDLLRSGSEKSVDTTVCSEERSGVSSLPM